VAFAEGNMPPLRLRLHPVHRPGICTRPVAGSGKPVRSRDREFGEGIVNVEESEKRFGVKQAHDEFGLNQSELMTAPCSNQ
jgi:hypothetical protein